MTLINYDQAMSFGETVEAFAIILQSCLVKLKDEAAFREDEEEYSAALNAAYFLLQMLEDAQATVNEATNRLESRSFPRTN
jgi:succinate dehydrogenase/fumarate reductase flavoprotein subunit